MRSLVIALVLALCAGTAFADGASEGTRAPEFDGNAKTATGKKFKIKKQKGKWVVVTFGASWCKPCHDELPAWDTLAGKYKGKVLFVAVNIDNEKDKGAAFMKKLKIKNMLIVFAPEEGSKVADTYVGSDDPHMPSTFVIDPKGIIRAVHPEYHSGDADKLASKIDELMSGS